MNSRTDKDEYITKQLLRMLIAATYNKIEGLTYRAFVLKCNAEYTRYSQRTILTVIRNDYNLFGFDICCRRFELGEYAFEG